MYRAPLLTIRVSFKTLGLIQRNEPVIQTCLEKKVSKIHTTETERVKNENHDAAESKH